MDLIKTGIDGLDNLLKGGISRNRQVAIYGGPGTGKTSLGFEFLYRGAKEGEVGVYFTAEEPPENIAEDMKNQFTQWDDLDSLLNTKINFAQPKEISKDGFINTIEETVISTNASRLVIDSTSVLKALVKGDAEYRKTIVAFSNLLRTLNITTFMIVEAETSEREKVRYDIEHYILDGVINLYYIQKGDTRIRALEIYKMRGREHSLDLVPFRITPGGINVMVGEKVF
jgi:circadian clock protein KaiC